MTNALPPLYSTWASFTLPIQRAALYPAVYGSFFSNNDNYSRAEEIDKDICKYCADVCRAIEVLEGENWTFKEETTSPYSAEVFYLFYLRDRVNGRFAHLNARFADARSRELCVLLATKIVEYILFMDNYIAAIPASLAMRLQIILDGHDLNIVWQGWEDVLMWIVFVLTCMPNDWPGREWSIELGRRMLRHMDSSKKDEMQETCKELVLNQLKRFVWSMRFDEDFLIACTDLNLFDKKNWGSSYVQ